MNWIKGFALVTCLATPLSVIVAASATAEPAADAKPAMTGTTKPTMTDAEKRAKAADCTKQANEKKLHGSEREKFRAACKRK